MKILVKLPVKLGDTIMAAYFLRAVKEYFPESQLDVIVARGLSDLLTLMPYVDNYHEFSKQEYSGPLGNYHYGRKIARNEQYDLFFCLPFSFSSALSGFFTRSKIRVGFKTEHRGFLFTKAIQRPKGLHIVEEFNYLLQSYTGKEVHFAPLDFQPNNDSGFDLPAYKMLVLNIKSGPPSRSIPVQKAISIVQEALQRYEFDIVLTGAPNETTYISEVKGAYSGESRVHNLAGKTSISELCYLISKAECMITTDSGNAHIANAVATPTVVLFGAAHPHRAKPFDQSISRILRKEEMDCVPCQSEHCRYGDNRCLSGIENAKIFEALDDLLS
jgi:lipopolysaccharide heptosyltransferase II